jgi:LuxR family maltose regulon positive regulatory protein
VVGELQSRYTPPASRPAVLRPELFDRLDEGVRGPLTLVTGPPGAGKTSLLVTWLEARALPGPVAWLSLEPIHARPGRFWPELLTVVHEAAGDGQITGLDQPVGPELDLVDSLGDTALALTRPLVLILDDFERLHSRAVVEGLDRFLRKRSDRIRLVIVSRLDPGLALQRHRLEGRLTELRGSHLALSRAQAEELFAMAGLDLSRAQIERLHDRTEGWAGGLALAALSLAEHPDPEGFIRTFAGDERSVAEYLVEEVLHQQPADMCDFMLRTSVVDQLEPGLADALTGRQDGAQMLERLERENAFLLALDRRRYRYHPMFRELLRSQLRYRMPDAFALEHRRAARWFAANGMAAVAVRHALSAGDTTAATELVSQHWLSLVVRGHGEEVVAHFDGLAQQAGAASAELALAAAGALLDAGDLQRAEKCIALADTKVGSVAAKRRGAHNLARAVVRMVEARVRGDFEAARSAAVKVLAGHQLAVVPVECRLLALLNLGIAECSLGSTSAGREHLEEARELSRRESCPYLELDCLAQLGLVRALEGALRESTGFARAAVRLAEGHGWEQQPVAAAAYLALAMTAFYRSEPQASAEHLERAHLAAQRSQEHITSCLIDLMAALLLASSDVEEAARIARAARGDTELWALPPGLAARAAVVEAALLAYAGQEQRAGDALAVVPAGQMAAEVSLVHARLALADGDPAGAIRQLQPNLEGVTEVPHPASRIEALGLTALARHLQHDDATALSLVERALAEAQPQGYRQPLLSVGAPLRELLKRRVRAGTAQRALAGDLIQALEPRRGISSEDQGHLLLDPLSDREEAVLRYLPTLMSKAEIAAELFVSVNTVKTHTKNIYRKLGVGTRTEAVRRAKSLNLV